MADEPNWNLNFVDFDDNSKSRFIDVSKDDVDKLIAEQENENTKRKTTYDLNIVLKYLREVRKEDRELEEIPPQELNLFLSEFIIAARTKKGEQYEPSSLRGILTSVDRYLTRREYGKRLFTDPEFTRLRDALKAKQKELKKDGRGNKPKATTALLDEEIDILFEKNVLGTSSPQSLLNTVWLNNIIHFGLRGCTEQRNLRWGDVVLETDSQGKEYLVHSERQTKSRQGDDPRNVRPVKPRMYENKEIPAERNPVNVYKLYRNKRPQSMLEPDAPFYLTVNHFKSSVQGQQRDCTWFKAQPMGVNKLTSILKDMCEVGGIPRKTNHAGRKTLVQKLQDNDVPPNQIIQITGHKNLQSINNYSGLRERQMESISNILSSTASTSREVSDVSQRQQGAFHSSVGAPPLRHYQLSTNSSTSSVHENQLQTMFYGNTISGGVFNITMASSQSAVGSPESEPPKKKFRRVLCIESDSGSSQEN